MRTQGKHARLWQKAALGLLLVCLLALAGCRSEATSSSSSGLSSKEVSRPSGASSEAFLPEELKQAAGGAGLEAARSAALAHAGLTAGQVTYLKELVAVEGRDDVYELEFVTETTCYEYEVRASDNAVLECSQEPVLQLEIQQEGFLTVEEAKTAALAAAKVTQAEAAFTKIELERDEGVPEYTLEFVAGTMEYECTLDAFTGEVLKQEAERFL